MNTQAHTGQALLTLFTQHGYRYVPINRFEEYDLYVENKNFFTSEHVITFMDTNGKLLALKPDITISVAKNLPPHALPALQKICYQDEVYRFSREHSEYEVVEQVGVELMGTLDAFSNLEIVDLALETLHTISPDFILDISHNGMVHGLLNEAGLGTRKQKEILQAVYSKSTHELIKLLESEAVSPALSALVLQLTELSGELLTTLPHLQPLIQNSAMQEAYDELVAIASSLADSPYRHLVRLDFSAIGDLDYYNGIVLLGYVKGSPSEVLSGGRYDKLLERMNKKNGALGFAVFLSELPLTKTSQPFDVDVLLLYPPTVDPAALLQAVKQLTRQGKSVRTEPTTSDLSALSVTYAKVLSFEA